MKDITLRPIEISDAVFIQPLANDYEVAKMVASWPHPYTMEDAKAFVEKVCQREKDKKGLENAILYKEEFAGVIGWFYNRLEEVEIGYWIARKFWGLGIGTRALQLKIMDIKKNPSPDKIIARVMEENLPSARLLLKVGFVAAPQATETCPSKARGGKEMIARKYELLL